MQIKQGLTMFTSNQPMCLYVAKLGLGLTVFARACLSVANYENGCCHTAKLPIADACNTGRAAGVFEQNAGEDAEAHPSND